MRRFVWLLIPFALVMAEDKAPADKVSKTAVSKKSKPSAPAPAPKAVAVTIPAGAEQLAPQVYRAKDADGKTWIYRQTPFGISKMEDHSEGSGLPVSAPDPSKPKIKVTARDLGDSVRFEQGTPMGARVWERKKSELTPQEKAWLEETRTVSSDSAKPEK